MTEDEEQTLLKLAVVIGSIVLIVMAEFLPGLIFWYDILA
jgi:hypothetical protein